MTKGTQVVLREFNAPLELREFEVPDPMADEIVVSVEMSGVCGSDVHTWRGTVARSLPMVLGHEGVGTVYALGTNIRQDYAGSPIKCGDRIYWVSFRACNSCYACTVMEDQAACENTLVYGRPGPRCWNTFADFATLPSGLKFFRIPDDTASEAVIAFGCAMPTMLQARRRLGQSLKLRSVVVQGCGPVGLAATLVAQCEGAGPIIAVDRVADRLDLARNLGATHTILLKDGQTGAELAEIVQGICGRPGADVVIEATGSISAFPQGLGMVGPNGRYLLVGLWAGSETAVMDPHHVLRRNIQIIGSAYATPARCYEAIKMAQRYQNQLTSGRIVTSRFGLDSAVQAFDAIRAGKAGKAVLVAR